MDHRQGPLRVPLRHGRRPAHLPAGPRRSTTATARCAPRRGPRRSPSPPAASPTAGGVGVLTGGRITAEDALRLQQVRPRRARHQRHRLPRPPALGRGGVASSPPRSCCRPGDVDVRRPRAPPTPSCWSASSPRTRPARSSCGCARPRQRGRHHGRRRSRRTPRAACARWAATLVADRARRRGRGARTLLGTTASIGSTATAVILVGERLATVARRAQRRRRAGRAAPAPGWPGCRAVPATAARSRPAACPTCCPAAVRSPTRRPASTSPPPGASTACPRRPAATPTRSSPRVNAGELGGLVVGGVDPDDTADPAAFRAALDAASFVVALELRETDVTRAADVVFPVAPGHRQGRHVRDLGGPPAARSRRCFTNPASLPDLRVLAGIAEELGHGPARLPHRRRGARPDGGARARGTATAPALDAGKPPTPAEAASGEAAAPWPPGSSCSTTARCRTATSNLRATARRAGRPRQRRPSYDALGADASRSPVTAAR